MILAPESFSGRFSPWSARLTIALVIGAILIALTVLCFPQRFESNDDPVMMRIAAGLYTDKPCEYLVFQNVLIGLFLKALYTNAPNLPWYALFLLGVHFLSVSALLFALFVRRFSFFSVLFFTLFFALLLVPILIQISFITTAFIAAVAGMVLLQCVDAGETPHRRIFFLVTGTLMLLLAGMIQHMVVLLAGVLSLPLILSVPKKSRLFVWSSIAACALLIFLLVRFHESYYARDTGWSEFLKHNRAREQLQDDPALAITDATRPHFTHVGWDENDIHVFKHFFQFDEQVFSTENLLYLARNLPHETRFGQNLQNMWNVLWANKLAAAFAAGLIVLTLRISDRKRRIVLLATAVVCAGMFFYMGLADGLSFGVAHSLILFSAWAAVWLICSVEAAPRLRDVWRWTLYSLPVSAITTVVVILAVLQAYWIVDLARENGVRNSRFERFVTGLVDRGAESIYVSYFSSVPAEDMSPFFRMRRLREYKSVPGGWLTGSPVYHAALKRLQMDDVNQALLTRPDCYLIVSEKLYKYADGFLPKFFLRHYHQKVILPPLARVSDTRVCRILVSR